MSNFVIIPDKRKEAIQNFSFYEEIPPYLSTGSLHYKFNTAKYKTLPNQGFFVVITNESGCFVGIKYDFSLEAPIVLLKGPCAAEIIKNCAEYNLNIVNNKSLAVKLFECDLGDYIPEECYEEVARILSKIKTYGTARI